MKRYGILERWCRPSQQTDISAQFEYFFNSLEKAMVEMNI